MSPINCVSPQHQYFPWSKRLLGPRLNPQFTEDFSQCFIEFVVWIIVWSEFRNLSTWFCSLINELMSLSYLSWLYNPKLLVIKFLRSKLFQYVLRLWFFCRSLYKYHSLLMSICWCNLNRSLKYLLPKSKTY